MRKKLEFLEIEKEFFDIDEEARIAHIDLEYEKPGDMFDLNCKTKTPLFNDDFDDWINSAFSMVPFKYGIELDVRFKDMDGYEPAELEQVFRKNLLLTAKQASIKYVRKTWLAISLIVIGLLFFVAMMLVGNLWRDGGIGHDIFFYIFDIFTTVLFWEAAGILLVENHELGRAAKGFRERFKKITFGLTESE